MCVTTCRFYAFSRHCPAVRQNAFIVFVCSLISKARHFCGGSRENMCSGNWMYDWFFFQCLRWWWFLFNYRMACIASCTLSLEAMQNNSIHHGVPVHTLCTSPGLQYHKNVLNHGRDCTLKSKWMDGEKNNRKLFQRYHLLRIISQTKLHRLQACFVWSCQGFNVEQMSFNFIAMGAVLYIRTRLALDGSTSIHTHNPQ